LVPRAYGGVDGPTVTICDSHHTLVHNVGLCLIKSKPFFPFLKGEADGDRRQKILYLATCIANAEQATRNDPNKAATAVLTLNAKHKSMIDSLKKVYPTLRSREAVLLQALENLHHKHFKN
jgi:hypothetical protein